MSLQALLSEYGESHQNPINKFIHWICVPSIFFSIAGLIFTIPFIQDRTMWMNWTAVVLGLTLLYYLRLSIPMFFGFILVAFLCLWGAWKVFEALSYDAASMAWWMFGIFALAWVGQFIGHHIEGKKPSFFKDLQFLLIGPAWLMHFIYKKLGIRY